MREQKIYSLSFAKEEKKGEGCSITLASYAKEIAGDVFHLMADETFMEKVHAYIEEEKKEKQEEKKRNDSRKKGAIGTSGTDTGILPMLMTRPSSQGQIQV